ncbi:MAG: iron-sulfur cluster repair di-iron protein [Planctomycetes bacterium]|nr:iron-sulfur cluster repair di-iron protein [Planctomycetota bacterium]
MTDIEPSKSVGQLVAERPSRARVFERFGIDFCCGGKIPLSDACTERKLDTERILAALREADSSEADTDEPDWTRATLSALIAHILQKHHAYLRNELPRLAKMVAKVHDVHGERHPELAEVRQTYDGLHAELASHMMKEEQILFPLIEAMESSQSLEAAHCGSVNNPISMMEHEHDSAGAALARLRSLTGDFTPPEDACNTYRVLLDGLAELEADLHRHIHKENNILFPRASELEAALAHSNSTTQV